MDQLDVTAEISADRLEALRTAIKRLGGRVVAVTGEAGTAPPTLADARRRMVADATAFQLRTLDALYARPGHEATLTELALDLGEHEQRVLGALGSLGAKLNRQLTGQRARAMHLWAEETTSLSGHKLYRLRPEFISECGRWSLLDRGSPQ